MCGLPIHSAKPPIKSALRACGKLQSIIATKGAGGNRFFYKQEQAQRTEAGRGRAEQTIASYGCIAISSPTVNPLSRGQTHFSAYSSILLQERLPLEDWITTAQRRAGRRTSRKWFL